MKSKKAELAKEMYTRNYQGSVGLMVPTFLETSGTGISVPDVTKPIRHYFNELSFLSTVRPKVTQAQAKIASEKDREEFMQMFDELRFKGSQIEMHSQRLQKQAEGQFDPTRFLRHDVSRGIYPEDMNAMTKAVDDHNEAYTRLAEYIQQANTDYYAIRDAFYKFCDQATQDGIEGEWFVVKRQREDEVLLKAAQGSCAVLTEAFELAHKYKYHIDVQCDPETMQLSFERPVRGAKRNIMC